MVPESDSSIGQSDGSPDGSYLVLSVLGLGK